MIRYEGKPLITLPEPSYSYFLPHDEYEARNDESTNGEFRRSCIGEREAILTYHMFVGAPNLILITLCQME